MTVRLGPTALFRRTVNVRRLALQEAFRVALDGDQLLVADAGGGRGRVLRIDPRTGERSIVRGTEALGRVYDVEITADGLLVVASDKLAFIRAGRARLVASGLRAATDLALADRDTGYIVEAEANRVRRVDLRSGRVTTVVDKGLDQPLAMAVARNGEVLVADGHSDNEGRVRRIGRSGTLLPLIDGLTLPVSVSVLADNRLLLVDHVRHDANGKILVYDGSKRIAAPADGTVRAPTSAVMSADGVIYATSGAPPGVGRLDASGHLRDLRP